MDLKGAMQGIVDELVAAGVRATLDARDVNPPCVLLRTPTLNWRFQKGGWDAGFEADLLVPDSGRRGALADVGNLISTVQEALNYRGVSARPEDFLLADGSTVPGYVLTWTQRIPT
jgi:hypothetical protein